MAATRPSRPSQRSEGRGATHQPVAAAAAVTGALKIRILMYALTAPTLMEGGREGEAGRERENNCLQSFVRVVCVLRVGGRLRSTPLRARHE